MKPVIEVQNLNVSYGSQRILENINFEIYPNQITVILGKSGSGKTTVLKHLIGLQPIEDGYARVMEFQINGIDEENYERLSRRIGVLFQNGALLKSLTVGENVAIPLEQHTSLPEELVDYLVNLKLELVDLAGSRLLFPAQLSGGMRKRAAMARALAMDPPMLFCDEPSAGLDPVTLKALDHLFLKLKEDLGITIVLVTHEISTIRRLADRIVFLEDGKAIFSGTLQEGLSAGISSLNAFFSQSSSL
jgi:phospholipid/cholesterol/gamma-HCH transport system ATP-binding protein